MIVSDFYMTRPDGVRLMRTYSDQGVYIERDGNLYADAVDPENAGRIYTETDIPIDPESDEATAEDYEAALSEMGVPV